jgi:hypothetical protein
MLLLAHPPVTLCPSGLPGFLGFVFLHHPSAPVADTILPSVSNSSL